MSSEADYVHSIKPSLHTLKSCQKLSCSRDEPLITLRNYSGRST